MRENFRHFQKGSKPSARDLNKLGQVSRRVAGQGPGSFISSFAGTPASPAQFDQRIFIITNAFAFLGGEDLDESSDSSISEASSLSSISQSSQSSKSNSSSSNSISSLSSQSSSSTSSGSSSSSSSSSYSSQSPSSDSASSESASTSWTCGCAKYEIRPVLWDPTTCNWSTNNQEGPYCFDGYLNGDSFTIGDLVLAWWSPERDCYVGVKLNGVFQRAQLMEDLHSGGSALARPEVWDTVHLRWSGQANKRVRVMCGVPLAIRIPKGKIVWYYTQFNIRWVLVAEC